MTAADASPEGHEGHCLVLNCVGSVGAAAVYLVGLAATTTLVANTVSVVRWKRPAWGWRLGGVMLGALAIPAGMYFSAHHDTWPMQSYALEGMAMILAPANLVMATWANYLPEKKIELTTMPMVDMQGAIVPGVGLRITRF